MQLESSDFRAGATIPLASMATDCGGSNQTPALRWSGAPAGTKSFALVVRDPDAPIAGGFYHWVVYNIPAQTHELARNAVPASAQLGTVSTGKAAYYGPCPPPGPAHHYIFELYALDVAHVGIDPSPNALELQQRIGSHVLAKATLTALASHH
ncbi:MAG: YbhB/YbcL family Raf kinase inhibitor-like protein [Candidatus Eremiobacteraeota bacterium]|nr:YbhB/YbcL family Raf kinase inhibitor-like protein [Candidatus Eremiobacteraeota bacterium]MBV8374572.1 YbhB/YbcL family Raf kinase inhibitor-like protein [Candidatus Eremiobacteraeota bacterium]